MAVYDRASIKNGFFQDVIAEGERLGLITRMSEEDRIASRAAMVASAPDPDNIWVFAYGSLMWNPAFHFAESTQATLYGYHRAFCLKTEIGRGNPDAPGLLLGLDRGGCCKGLAYRVHRDQVCEELDIIWSREMVADTYTPRWVTLNCATGKIPAIGFVMERHNERYINGLSLNASAVMIAKASGALGPCSEYLENTVMALDEIGIGDGPLHRLLDEVKCVMENDG